MQEFPPQAAEPDPPFMGPVMPASPTLPTSQRSDIRIVVAAVVAAVVGFVAGGAGFLAADLLFGGQVRLPISTRDNPLAERPPESVAGIVENVAGGVVTVGVSGNASGNGSGFVIDKSGYILTNNHVVTAGSALNVVFSDGTVSDASVVGKDSGSDVAVIKVDRPNLEVLALGDSDSVRVGDPTFAFGAPLGLSGTVTAGIVSAVDRPVVTGDTADDTAFMAAIQTDAAINPGNSGGPLVNGAGEVVGINSAIATASDSDGNIGLGFSIPINHARRVAEQIINTGTATTTIIGATLDRQYDTPGAGVRLESVEEGSPAAEAGLQGGDIILLFEDHVVEDPVALIALIRKEAPGSIATIEYERDGDRHETKITLGER